MATIQVHIDHNDVASLQLYQQLLARHGYKLVHTASTPAMMAAATAPTPLRIRGYTFSAAEIARLAMYALRKPKAIIGLRSTYDLGSNGRRENPRRSKRPQRLIGVIARIDHDGVIRGHRA